MQSEGLLVADHPDSPLVAALAADFAPESAGGGGAASPVERRLAGVDLNTLNPMGAFSLVCELKALVGEKG